MNMKRSSWLLKQRLQIAALVVIVFLAGAVFGSQFSISQAQNSDITLPEDAQAAFEPLFETYNLIQRQYIDPTEATNLADGAIKGMVEALEDEYSGYVDPEHFPFISDDLSGEIEGIGVVITEVEDTGEIEVVNVLPDTPAERNGIEVGDIFMVVDGEDVVGLSTLELATRVRGPAGSTVDLTMRRDGELVDFTIERAAIEVPIVESELLDGNVAYVKLTQFAANARDQVDLALTELDVNSRNGLVFDLRGNPGGLLSAATEIGGLFLEEGTLLIESFGDDEEHVFEIRDGSVIEVFDDGAERVYTDNAAYGDVRVPVVVLIDERSASASEVVTGAWKDHDTVTLMGETSFGKGTVQIQNTLVNGGGLRLTVARWLTPDRSWISSQGITPDVVVQMPDDPDELAEGEDPQLDAALEFLESKVAEAETSVE